MKKILRLVCFMLLCSICVSFSACTKLVGDENASDSSSDSVAGGGTAFGDIGGSDAVELEEITEKSSFCKYSV